MAGRRTQLASGSVVACVTLPVLAVAVVLLYPPILWYVGGYRLTGCDTASGAGVVMLGLAGCAIAVSIARTPVTDPAQPWTERADWNEGRVVGTGGWSSARWLWFTNLYWSAFAALGPYAILTDTHGAARLPLVWMGVLGIALR